MSPAAHDSWNTWVKAAPAPLTVSWAVNAPFPWIQHRSLYMAQLTTGPKGNKYHKLPCLTHLGDAISSLWPTSVWEVRVCFSNPLLFKGCYWITDPLGLEGTSGSSPGPTPCSGRATKSPLPRTRSIKLLSISQTLLPHPTFVDLSVTKSWICLLQHCHTSDTTNSTGHYF